MSAEERVVPEQLYCVLLSLAGETLLLPNAAVAEAVGFDSLRPGAAGHWFAGTLNWLNRRIPAVQFEVLNGASPPPVGRRSRLVVLHPVSSRVEDLPFAIVCQGYPHLITLSRIAVVPQPLHSSDRPEFVLARVRIGNTEALIPNIDHIAEMLLQTRAQEQTL